MVARSFARLTRVPGVDTVMRRFLGPRDARLAVSALGLSFPSPLGVAAGMDKDGSWFESLGTLGFGFVEIGTVTARAQDGNPRPRVFRVPERHALINSMGFPNPGAHATATRLRRTRRRTLVGANIGKSKVVSIEDAGADYRSAIRELVPVADYVVLNVSSPNTPGLRDMQAVERLASLLIDAREELSAMGAAIPTLVKIGPDLTDAELDAIGDLAVEAALDGIIAVNTTLDRTIVEGDVDLERISGGLSGAPLKARSLEVLRRLRSRVGRDTVLVSVGGIENAQDAWERIIAGASLIQAHTGFVYGGPLWPSRINRGLLKKLRDEGFASIEAAIGSAAEPVLTQTTVTSSSRAGVPATPVTARPG